MELEDTNTQGDKIHLVKVCEEIVPILQRAFMLLKNPDHHALQHHFLVPDMPVTIYGPETGC